MPTSMISVAGTPASLLKTAAQVADAAFLHVLDVVRAGVSELEVAHALENYMKKQGTDTTGFSPIVASGYRGALAHGRASDKIIPCSTSDQAVALHLD